MSIEKAEMYRASLRKALADDGIVGDAAILSETRKAISDQSVDRWPNLVAFHAVTLLLFGDRSNLGRLLTTIVGHPEVLREKPYSAFHGALKAVLPLPLELPDEPRAIERWCLEHMSALHWDPQGGTYLVNA